MDAGLEATDDEPNDLQTYFESVTFYIPCRAPTFTVNHHHPNAISWADVASYRHETQTQAHKRRLTLIHLNFPCMRPSTSHLPSKTTTSSYIASQPPQCHQTTDWHCCWCCHFPHNVVNYLTRSLNVDSWMLFAAWTIDWNGGLWSFHLSACSSSTTNHYQRSASIGFSALEVKLFQRKRGVSLMFWRSSAHNYIIVIGLILWDLKLSQRS